MSLVLLYFGLRLPCNARGEHCRHLSWMQKVHREALAVPPSSRIEVHTSIQLSMLDRAHWLLLAHLERQCSVTQRCGQCATMVWAFPASGSNRLARWIASATGKASSDDPDATDCHHFSIIEARPGNTSCGLCAGSIDQALILVRHPLTAIWSAAKALFGRSDAEILASSDLLEQWEHYAMTQAHEWSKLWQLEGDYRDWIDSKRRFIVARFEDIFERATGDHDLLRILAFAGFDVCGKILDTCHKTFENPISLRNLLWPRYHERPDAARAWHALGDRNRFKAWAILEPAAASLGYFLSNITDNTQPSFFNTWTTTAHPRRFYHKSSRSPRDDVRNFVDRRKWWRIGRIEIPEYGGFLTGGNITENVTHKVVHFTSFYPNATPAE